MAVRIQFRRGTQSEWISSNPTLAAGELGYESTNKIIKFGDGSSAWDILPIAAAGDIYAIRVGSTSGLRYAFGTTGYGTASAGESGVIQLEVDPTQVVMTSTFDSSGDTLVGTGQDTYSVLHVGTNGQTIIADSTAPLGIKWGTPTNPTITNNYINSDMLGTGVVTEAKIKGSASVDADRSITTDKIRDSAITEGKINGGAVTEGKIGLGAVTNDKIKGDANDANDAVRAVTTDKIRNSAITNAKLGPNAVSSAKVDTTVYVRGTINGFTATSAKVHIGPYNGTTPTGNAGDIWLAYE